MEKKPVTVSVTLVMLYVNAGLWLLFALLVGSGRHPSLPDRADIRWGVAVLALLAAGALAVVAWLLSWRKPAGYWLTLAILLLAVLSILLDQVGLSDLIALALVLVPAVFLLKDRRWYTQPGSGESGAAS
jgi:hypothetical protein